MNQPISPLPTDDEPFNARFELAELGHTSNFIGDTLCELLEHESSESHLSITLDWAYELRRDQNLDWGDAIRAAMIAYFG